MGAEIIPCDWARMLTGGLPGWFFLEIFLRATVIYALVLICMRLLGKRTHSHLSLNERAGISSLAAAVGMPILNPDRGLLPAMVVALTVVALQRTLSKGFTRHRKLEALSQGVIDTLVKDGILQWNTAEKTHVSRGRIFAQLRKHGLFHLGEVERLYLEAGGQFTLVRASPSRTGLAILPEEDRDFMREQAYSGEKVCASCGAPIQEPLWPCLNCGSLDRVYGLIPSKKGGVPVS
jgi:uncharacterized membrane protein YcaP (DUF421 family)